MNSIFEFWFGFEVLHPLEWGCVAFVDAPTTHNVAQTFDVDGVAIHPMSYLITAAVLR